MQSQTPTIVAKAVYHIDGEEGEFQSAVIVHEHAFWLVATWLELTATGERFPDRIVPLAQFDPAEPRASPIRLARSVPRELLFQDCPPATLEKHLAQTHPCIAQLPTKGGIQ